MKCGRYPTSTSEVAAWARGAVPLPPNIKFEVSIQRGSRGILALSLSALAISAFAQTQAPPEYLKNRLDPIQRTYSKAVYGFALNKKCNVLTAPAEEKYERDLNLATEIFNAYSAAKGFAVTPDQTQRYTKELITSASRFASLVPCATEARESIESGVDTAEHFPQLIQPALNQPIQE